MPTSAPAIDFFPADDKLAAHAVEVQLRAQYSPRLTVSNTTDVVLWDYVDGNGYPVPNAALSGQVGFFFSASRLTLAARFNRIRMDHRGDNYTLTFRQADTTPIRQVSTVSGGGWDDGTVWCDGDAYILDISATAGITADNLAFWYVEPDSPSGDPYWNQVPLLLNFEGTNGSSTIPDVSSYARTVTNNNVVLQTAQKAYGVSSGYFNGTNAYLEVAPSSDFAFLGRVTIEGWVRFDTFTGVAQTFFTYGPNSGVAATITIGLTSANQLTATFLGSTMNAGILSAGNWYQIALVRSGNTLQLFIDGTSSSQSTSLTLPPAGYIRLGSSRTGTNFFKGWMDNWRITNGVDRYSKTFVPYDLFVASGTPDVALTFSATESTQDSFSARFNYMYPIQATVNTLQEANPDTFSASVAVVANILTILYAYESGQDQFSAKASLPMVAVATATGTSTTRDPAPDIRIDPIDKYIFDGIQSRFVEVFNTATVWTTSTDKVRALDRLFPGRDKASVVYPYAFLKITGWELATDRRNNRDSTLRGVPVSMSDDGKSYLSVKFLPVNFSVSVEFITNNFREVLNFARDWVIAARSGFLSFQVEYGLTTLDVPLLLETNVSFPQREGTPEEVQEYVAEVTFSVMGYISDPKTVQNGVVDALDFSLAVAPSSKSNIGDAGVEVFWSFKQPTGGNR